MATVAAPMYGAHHHGFVQSTSTNTSISSAQPIHHQHQHQQPEPELLEDQFTTLFCRALYDYEAQDASALSFHRNDIIEVLTQQPSGWWDGLLGDERGWFPSNYVTVISDEEAELAFSGSDFSNTEGQNDSMVDMSHAMMRGSQSENEEWLERELGSRNGLDELANATLEAPTQSSDFWMPQVTPDGQIYYVNTQTGQHSRDLPQEADDEASDGDLAGLTSQSSSRSGTSAGLGLGTPTADHSGNNSDASNPAGFGVPRRTGTPEPWVRKLADDGMSYYYWNKIDNKVQWTRPENPPIQPVSKTLPLINHDSHLASSRLRSGSQPRQFNHTATARLSVYSDDSDVQPHEGPRTAHPQPNGRARRKRRSLPVPVRNEQVVVELTSAERIAQTLQQALSPSPPELVTDLSAIARKAIQAVVENIQLNGITRRPEEDEKMDTLVHGVVLAVRNLLYVSAAPTGHIPSNVIPRDARDPRTNASTQSLLKPAQRKVTATLSKLVLSARAMQYDSGASTSETPNRIEGDAEELERAVVSFVLEVQRSQHQVVPDGAQKHGLKRLHGVFVTANIGLGLVGAGAAGGWKGFGWISLDDEEAVPRRILGTEVVAELVSYLSQLEDRLISLGLSIRASGDSSVHQVRAQGQDLITHISSFLTFVANIHVARHVDIDGIRQESGHVPNDLYAQTVDRARLLVRTLEIAVQSLYDDSSALFLTTQSVRQLEPGQPQQDRDFAYEYLDALTTCLKSNLGVVHQTLEALLSVGHDQADMAQGDYNGSIEWRMSRLSVIDGAPHPISSFRGTYDVENEDMVDMSFAFGKQGTKVQGNGGDPAFDSTLYSNMHMVEAPSFNSASGDDFISTTDETMVAPDSPGPRLEADGSPLFDDDVVSASARSPPRAGSNKIRKLLGDDAPQHYLDTVNADLKPWYLRPNYSQTEILMDPDGTVRGGTVQALVERLTAHEHGDPTFIKTFLMTYKSFTTLDELFNLLVQRFWIQPPANLTSAERDEWVKLKQHVIQMRVINTFKSMVVDDDVLEKEDLYILDRMKEFISTDEVVRFAAAKQLMILIERAQRGGDAMVKMMVNTGQQAPPQPIVPKNSGSRKLKLLDVDPLELARQLTIMESQLYQKIRPMECLQRSREQKIEHSDNIAIVIQTSNRIADWVAESILSKDDSRRRAAAVKQFISVADRCRTLHNYSTMVAITSGLNTPPIRRLKRTWEQVNQKFMAQLGACEMTIDTTKNFNNYRSTMASVTPPCVPFIGVFLTTLQFIQDGNPDNLPGTLVNFRKRQKASEVINDIKRWQAQPFNFHPIPSVLSYIEESLSQFSDTVDVREHFWKLSLDREPREREDEKMARLLQESGFL